MLQTLKIYCYVGLTKMGVQFGKEIHITIISTGKEQDKDKYRFNVAIASYFWKTSIKSNLICIYHTENQYQCLYK